MISSCESGRPRRLVEDALGCEPRVLAARGPRQVSDRLQACITGKNVDPVTRLHPLHERQHLVRGQIERVQRQAQVRMLHEREESKSAVAGPLGDETPFTARMNAVT